MKNINFGIICANQLLTRDLLFFLKKLGKQPKPVRGVHNSGWKQSPGMALVHEIYENKEHDEDDDDSDEDKNVYQGHMGNLIECFTSMS